jgi:hypothetical protein
MPNTFAIWTEPYPCKPKPFKLGYGVGETFQEACEEWAERTLSTSWFDKKNLVYAGLNLHKSRTSAEKKRKKRKKK